jgi:hypothetical protein
MYQSWFIQYGAALTVPTGWIALQPNCQGWNAITAIALRRSVAPTTSPILDTRIGPGQTSAVNAGAIRAGQFSVSGLAISHLGSAAYQIDSGYAIEAGYPYLGTFWQGIQLAYRSNQGGLTNPLWTLSPATVDASGCIAANISFGIDTLAPPTVDYRLLAESGRLSIRRVSARVMWLWASAPGGEEPPPAVMIGFSGAMSTHGLASDMILG